MRIIDLQTSPNVCLCKYHENFMNAINSLDKATSDFLAYSRTFPESLICDQSNEACLLNNCKKCNNGIEFSDKYSIKIQPNLFAQWAIRKNEKANLIKVSEEEMVKKLNVYITKLIPQCFRARLYQMQSVRIISKGARQCRNNVA